jgi:hypothetical protein
MESVKNYWEYRDYLRDFYAERKNENQWYSLRYMGGKVSVDPSHLVKIFQRERHIGNALIDVFIDHCRLSGSDADYFANLVRFNKAKSDRDCRMYYERLLALKGPGARTLEKSQYEFYTKWYHSAILTLLDFYPFSGDYAALAAKVSPRGESQKIDRPAQEARAHRKNGRRYLSAHGQDHHHRRPRTCHCGQGVSGGDHADGNRGPASSSRGETEHIHGDDHHIGEKARPDQ